LKSLYYDARSEKHQKMTAVWAEHTVRSRQLWRYAYRKVAFCKCAVWRFVGRKSESNFRYYARHASL